MLRNGKLKIILDYEELYIFDKHGDAETLERCNISAGKHGLIIKARNSWRCQDVWNAIAEAFEKHDAELAQEGGGK